MNVKLVTITKMAENEIYEKENYLEIMGMAASISRDENDDKFFNEDKAERIKRSKVILAKMHTSVAEHTNYGIFLEGLSKTQTILINNNLGGGAALTERSLRYCKVKDNTIYDKWYNKLSNKGVKNPKEIARYHLSAYDEYTCAYYTVNARQLSVFYHLLKDFIENDNTKSELTDIFKSEAKKLVEKIEEYEDKILLNIKPNIGQKLRLFINMNLPNQKNKYSYIYNSSVTFVTLGQLQRHRKINYYINTNNVFEVKIYVPYELLDESEIKEWIDDVKMNISKFPLAIKVPIVEMGFLSDIDERYHLRKGNEVQTETRDYVLEFTNMMK